MSLSPSNQEPTALNAAQSRLPSLSPEFINKHYPSQLQLLHVDVLTRHGERTPIAHQFPEVSPKHWNFCQLGNKLHADFVAAVGAGAGAGASSDNSKSQWHNYVFHSDARNLGAVFGVTGDKVDQHAGDLSKKTSATCSFGQLTDVGRHSMFSLGAHLRTLYAENLKFLPMALASDTDGHPTPDLYLRSTPFSRSVESLQHTLGGLCPDVSNPQRVRMHVRPSAYETMFPDFNCKRMFHLFTQLNAKSIELFAGEYEALYQELRKIPSLRNFYDSQHAPGKTRVAISAWDAMSAMRAHGLPLPDGVDDQTLDRLSQMAAVEFIHSLSKSTELARLEIGPLVHELVGGIVAAVEADRGKRPGSLPKMSIYSGHDTTIGPMLAVLGDQMTGPPGLAPVGMQWPPFASSIRIELMKDTQTDYPTVQPYWAADQADHSEDPSKIPFDKRIRPINVPESFYTSGPLQRVWKPSQSPQYNPRAIRDYYVRVWFNDRAVQLPTCRDPGAHHTGLGPTVCTLDGFFKQIARFTPSKQEMIDGCKMT